MGFTGITLFGGVALLTLLAVTEPLGRRRLTAALGVFELRQEFVPSRGPLGWRMRRHLARVKLRRAPAAFGLWVSR